MENLLKKIAVVKVTRLDLRKLPNLNGGKKTYKCHICNKNLSTNTVLKNHIQEVHEAMKPFYCDICGTKFAQKVNLETHIISVHENVKKHECKICNQNFKLVQHLKQHIKRIHEKNLIAYKCHICT